MSSVLACDPDELRATVTRMRRVVAELDAVAGDLTGPAQGGWSGLAALEQAARRGETARAVRGMADPLERVAGALTELEVAAREHGATVRRHTRLLEEVVLERHRLLALGTPPEPAAAARWLQRIAVLEEEQAWHERLVEAAEQEFDQVCHRVTTVLEVVRAHVPQIVWDLALVVATARRVVSGSRQAVAAAALADSARRIHRMPVPGGERTLHRMRERIARHVGQLKGQPPGWLSRVPGGAALASRAVPVAGGIDAFRGAVDGGGYDGLRGRTTRALGVLGVVGAGVALGAAAAPAGVVGLAGVAAYQAWMTGNWVYDNRDRIADTAARGRSGARAVGGRVWAGARGLAARARERARSGLDRLRAGGPGTVVAPGPPPRGAHA